MGTPSFIDISNYQGTSINWQAYKSWSAQGDGISRVALKATEGTGFVDPAFATNRANALAAGIDMLILYHFARPELNSPQAEANFMHSIVGSIRPQDIVILDFEENVPQATAEWALTWLQVAQGLYAKMPGIYASSAYITQRLQIAEIAAFPLWLANWQFTPDERPPVPAPWTSYEFVQYSDKASIPGVPGIVDADIFLGQETPPQEETMIDLTNSVVSQYFEATGDAQVWQLKGSSILLGHGMLSFYQKFGGDALCGLSYLGLPVSGELPVAGHPGVTIQEFERACLIYDPEHVIDSPPSAGSVYLVHVEGDPRYVALQTEISQLQALPAAANLLQINTFASQIVKLSQVQ